MGKFFKPPPPTGKTPVWTEAQRSAIDEIMNEKGFNLETLQDWIKSSDAEDFYRFIGIAEYSRAEKIFINDLYSKLTGEEFHTAYETLATTLYQNKDSSYTTYSAHTPNSDLLLWTLFRHIFVFQALHYLHSSIDPACTDIIEIEVTAVDMMNQENRAYEARGESWDLAEFAIDFVHHHIRLAHKRIQDAEQQRRLQAAIGKKKPASDDNGSSTSGMQP